MTCPCLAVSLADLEASIKVEQINSVRAYLSLVRHLEFTIHLPMTAFLEDQLVEARKQDKDLDPSTMHTWLTVRTPFLGLQSHYRFDTWRHRK